MNLFSFPVGEWYKLNFLCSQLFCFGHRRGSSMNNFLSFTYPNSLFHWKIAVSFFLLYDSFATQLISFNYFVWILTWNLTFISFYCYICVYLPFQAWEIVSYDSCIVFFIKITIFSCCECPNNYRVLKLINLLLLQNLRMILTFTRRQILTWLSYSMLKTLLNAQL